MEHKSEVARIKEQIALEYEAVNRIFKDPAITSRHDFINHRQANLGDYFEELTKHMTREEAIQVFIKVAEGEGA